VLFLFNVLSVKTLSFLFLLLFFFFFFFFLLSLFSVKMKKPASKEERGPTRQNNHKLHNEKAHI